MPNIPTEIEHLTAEWFSDVLGHEVVEATVVDRSSGTTGRARVTLRGDPGLPESVFVKLPPFHEQQRFLVDQTGLGVAPPSAPQLPAPISTASLGSNRYSPERVRPPSVGARFLGNCRL